MDLHKGISRIPDLPFAHSLGDRNPVDHRIRSYEGHVAVLVSFRCRRGGTAGLVLGGRDVRDRAHFVIVDEARPAAQAGIAGPAFEASLPEFTTRRYHAALLAVHTHFSVAVCFAEAMRLTRYVRTKPSWSENTGCGQHKTSSVGQRVWLVSFLEVA